MILDATQYKNPKIQTVHKNKIKSINGKLKRLETDVDLLYTNNDLTYASGPSTITSGGDYPVWWQNIVKKVNTINITVEKHLLGGIVKSGNITGSKTVTRTQCIGFNQITGQPQIQVTSNTYSISAIAAFTFESNLNNAFNPTNGGYSDLILTYLGPHSFEFKINILISHELSNKQNFWSDGESALQNPGDYAEAWLFKDLTININGTVLNIDTEESFSSGDETPALTIPSNELLQADAKYSSQDINDWLADSIIGKYTKGKQKLTLDLLNNNLSIALGDTIQIKNSMGILLPKTYKIYSIIYDNSLRKIKALEVT